MTAGADRTPSRPSNRYGAGRHGAVARSRTSLVLAVVIPLVTFGALTATNGEPAPLPGPVPPKDTALTSLQVVCPPPITGGAVSVSNVRVSGETQLRIGRRAVPPSPSSRTRPPWSTPPHRWWSTGAARSRRGSLRPGSTRRAPRRPRVRRRSRTTGSPGWVRRRSTPRSSSWSTPTPAGRSPTSRSTATNGLLPIDAVRGVTVPGGTATAIDLAETAPDRSELTVHVTVTRGRLGASMVNRIADDRSYADWLPPQAEPASSTVLLGLAAGRGERQLVVANPSDDQARVQIKVIGSDSTFAALGLDELSIPPQSVSVTDVGDVVGDAVAKEESGPAGDLHRSRHERPAVSGRLSCRGPQPCRRRNAGARGRVVAPGGQGDAGAGRSHRGRLGDGDVVRRGWKAAGDRAGGRQATDLCRARPPGQDLAGRRPCRGDAAARGGPGGHGPRSGRPCRYRNWC